MSWLNWKTMLVGLMAVSLVAITRIAMYQDDALKMAKDQLDQSAEQMKIATATITDMQARQRDVAALDTKYTQELTDAKNTIDQLQRDVADGRKRLRVNASCPSNVSPATGTPGVANAGSARLTPDAERDYYRHRAGIEDSDKMIRGLQEYVKTQCLK